MHWFRTVEREEEKKEEREETKSESDCDLVSRMWSVSCVMILEIRFAHEKSDVLIKALLTQPPLSNYPRVSSYAYVVSFVSQRS